eukprot:6183393-Pleurochrysis_carterae.AAC.1
MSTFRWVGDCVFGDRQVALRRGAEHGAQVGQPGRHQEVHALPGLDARRQVSDCTAPGRDAAQPSNAGRRAHLRHCNAAL